jgi:UDP-N-acetylmuramate--alanine ligase
VLNATAALGVIHQLGLPMDRAITALGDFTGAGRRFEILGQAKGITIIDDYGHHPTEITSTLQAAKEAYPDSRIWAIWQPHTFTRTKTLEAGFIKALSLADRVMVLKIYGAREEETLYTAECIANALPKGTAVYKETFEEATYELVQRLSPGDVAIFFSAGDATQVSQAVLSKLKNPSSQNIKMAGDL